MDSVVDVLHELLRHRRSGVDATSEFTRLKHNADLCPRFSAQLCDFLEGTRRYQNVVYDVQGLRDRGKDVVLRYGDDDESSTFVTFQIKSYDDIEDKGFLRTLKAQSFEVREDYGPKLDHHFIVLCTDLESHIDQVRSVCAEFSKSGWATVIEPQYALTFLRLAPARIDAIVQRCLREDDAVYKAAVQSIENHSPLESALLLCLLALVHKRGSFTIAQEDIQALSFLDEVLTFTPDVDRESFFYEEGMWDGDPPDFAGDDRHRDSNERISEALEVLDGGPIDLDTPTGTVLVSPVQSTALEALMLDAQVRFDFEPEELVRFLFETLDVSKMFDSGVDIYGA